LAGDARGGSPASRTTGGFLGERDRAARTERLGDRGALRNGDIDRDFFDFGLTDYTTSSQEFHDLLALNWYATRNLRLSAEYVRTQADDDIKSLGYEGDSSAGIVRAQYRF
jgi:hypothetical protein